MINVYAQTVIDKAEALDIGLIRRLIDDEPVGLQDRHTLSHQLHQLETAIREKYNQESYWASLQEQKK